MKDYFIRHRRAFVFLAIALAVILVSSFCGAMVQTDAFSVSVSDLRSVTAADYGVTDDKLLTVDLSAIEGSNAVKVTGFVESGLLFVPHSATADTPAPAVVLTHGYLNNREMQLPFAVELARRGFVVLAIDRENHGNNTVVSGSNYSSQYGPYQSAWQSGGAALYNAAAFLYYQDYVDQTKIGISGHSMGGASTNMALLYDKTARLAGGQGIISAGLVQANNPSVASYAEGVSVGVLKANDDEFFFASTLADGTKSISRQYLHSVGAATFVGLTDYPATADGINIENGGYYVNGTLVGSPEGGQAVGQAFRVIYEADEIHPLNHFSVTSTANLVEFFYSAFGTPTGRTYIPETLQSWPVKEMFATIGLVGFFMLVLPLADLLLTLPCFQSLRKKKVTTTGENGEIIVGDGEMLPTLKTPRQHVSYWFAALATTLFSGFMIQPIYSGSWSNLTNLFFDQNTYFPQDTTGTVATWAIVCGIFALLVTGIVWLINHIINVVKYKDEAYKYDSHPLQYAKIGGALNFVKTILLGIIIVFAMYLVVFINWGIWTVDFRFWTFDVKVFDVVNMLPTMLRYAVPFFIFYAINSIFNQTYRVKNLPEWATTAINAAFSIFGILLAMIIQYGTFKSTGVLWQGDMALGYIVLFPIIPVLIIATVLSRRLFKRTGNAWLGAVVNTLLFTIMTVANTSASYAYAGFFA